MDIRINRVIKSITQSLIIFTGIFTCISVLATNGIYLVGYSPTAMGMGGAGISYYHGSGGVMHNPATIGLRSEDGHQLETGLVFVAANINAEFDLFDLSSSAHERVVLPTMGFTGKKGRFGYGFTVFPQGGLSTLFSADRFLAAGTNEEPFSELGAIKASIPFTFDITDKLTIGASVSVLRAAIDINMPLTGSQFADFVPEFGGTQAFGTASGTFIDGAGMAIMNGVLDPMMPLNNARLEFWDKNVYNGEAKGYGYGGHLGLIYKVTDRFSVGLMYQSKLEFEDLDADSADLVLNGNVDDNILNGTFVPGVFGMPAGTHTATSIPISGKVVVKDFELPAQYGIGFSFAVSDRLTIAADVKRIEWNDALKSLKLSFNADSGQANPIAGSLANTSVALELFQHWKDQTVYAIGGQYQVNEALAVRAGVNIANNPIPEQFLNPLFPAIIKNHFTVGFTYSINKNQHIHAAMLYAPEVSDTNPISGVDVSHRQINTQLMYTHVF